MIYAKNLNKNCPDKKEIKLILEKNGVVRAGLFGSFARGDAKKNSDIDIIIKLTKGKSLLDMASIELELEKKFNKKFDLITYDSVHPLLKKRISNEEIKIL